MVIETGKKRSPCRAPEAGKSRAAARNTVPSAPRSDSRILSRNATPDEQSPRQDDVPPPFVVRTIVNRSCFATLSTSPSN